MAFCFAGIFLKIPARRTVPCRRYAMDKKVQNFSILQQKKAKRCESETVSVLQQQKAPKNRAFL